MPDLRRYEWERIIHRIHEGELIPIISDRVAGDFLPGYRDLSSKWADYIEFPFNYKPNLTRLAQFVSVDSGSRTQAKYDFLTYAKVNLLQAIAEERGGTIAIENAESLRFAEIADQFGYPQSNNGQENPLDLLARFPLPIYITTSYFNFLEIALAKYRQTPRVEICQWHDARAQPELEAGVPTETEPVAAILREILTESFNIEEMQTILLSMNIYYQDFRHGTRIELAHDLIVHLQMTGRIWEFIRLGKRERPDARWQDIVMLEETLADTGAQAPLVYHLYGLDERPESLVLTETDYLDFFKLIAFDKDAKKSFFSYTRRAELRQKPLLLLGYDLQDWEFRALFHGIIAELRELPNARGMRWAIQLRAESAKDISRANKYLEQYFGEHRFSVYWGSPAEFVQQLWQHYCEKYG